MENNYRSDVFLSTLRGRQDYGDDQIWREHQLMQFSFLRQRGLRPDWHVLDVGCGPMRLGVKLIPELTQGWYYGQDINAETLAFGQEILRDAGVEEGRYSLFANERFDFSAVDKPIDVAFSNSLFSHLNLNSILICLQRVRPLLRSNGVYYSTFFALDRGSAWLEPHPRNKWGNDFHTFPNQDPYHYPISLLSALAREADFSLDIAPDYGHPTQTMACFRPLGR